MFNGLTIFQFPLLGIFRCILWLGSMKLVGVQETFNSRYLGFSVASQANLLAELYAFSHLSIPATWDFPLHQLYLRTYLSLEVRYSFNSRYLGFSVASTGYGPACTMPEFVLSIPATWDFPLHPYTRYGNRSDNYNLLSIPATWDFPLHHCSILKGMGNIIFFQFPLLGIFRCIMQRQDFQKYQSDNFQFPLLGIFRCIFLL